MKSGRTGYPERCALAGILQRGSVSEIPRPQLTRGDPIRAYERRPTVSAPFLEALPMRVRTRPSFALLALLSFASACSDDTTGPEESSPAGSYTLASVNGSPLPYVIFQTLEDKTELTEAAASLNADGTCSTSMTLRTTQGGQVSSDTQSDTCTWSHENAAILITWTDGTTDTASWSGDTITVTLEGLVLVFER